MKLLPEEQFIINCLRSEFSGKSTDELKNFDLSHIDWDTAYEKSIQWRVAPLLYKIIKKQSPLSQLSSISEGFLQKIKKAYVRTFLINRTNFNKLIKVMKIFNEEGIKIMLLKGSHLAQFVYENVGLRPMVDIDIMVKKEVLHKAEVLLFQMGYDYIQMSQIAQKQDSLIERKKRSYHHLALLSNPKGINNLEVHWTLIRTSLPLNIDIEGLWERAKGEKINRTEVLVPSPEDNLLYISLHASYNEKFICGVRPLCDIAAIVNHYDNKIDWHRLQLRAYEWGAEKSLYLTLRLSRDILGLSLPGSVLKTLKPVPLNEKIFLEAQKRIFSMRKKEFMVKFIKHPEKFSSDISLLKKISYIFNSIFIHPHKLAVYYSLPPSSKRVYFYYFVRIYRNIVQYAKFLIYLLTHKKADFYNYNLDTWLIPSNSEKVKKTR